MTTSKLLVGDHTILDTVRDTGKVLDIGCQIFDFAKIMVDKGYEVHCIEPDSEVRSPGDINIILHNYALVAEQDNGKIVELLKCADSQANHLSNIPGSVGKVQNVLGISLQAFIERVEIPFWDVIKMNCEGAEYQTLLEWPGPISHQLTVSFHEHIGAGQAFHGADVYDRIEERLSQWYEIVQHDKSSRHCLSTLNYWDSLWVLKQNL